MVIWKYELKVVDVQEIVMPHGAELLSVANQDGTLCLWAIVKPDNFKQSRFVEILFTGEKMVEDPGKERKFLATVFWGPLVLHVFESVRVY